MFDILAGQIHFTGFVFLIFCGFYDICNLHKMLLGFHQPFVLSTKQGEGRNMSTEERREFARSLVDISVEFIIRGRLYQGQIKNMNKEGWIKVTHGVLRRCRNVNKGGVFIETGGSFSTGQNISITYQSLNLGKENRIGKIVWVSHQGIGVKFRKPLI
ncbi:hypothetical protein LCGC14_2563970 [marine sediment metagenome]|uniref:PilZ domain-containing protein n=1 Tax=marine sediment metagenome TaxID=412755 RepID=A0A0F9CVE3_9ZZZZ